MIRHAALLRGINLGTRRVKMDRLREELAALGLREVRTLLASGNVVFDHAAGETQALEGRIEAHLADALGYEVDTFVRELSRLEELCAEDEVTGSATDGFEVHVLFLREAPDAEAAQALAGLESPDDRFRLLGREVVWLRRGKLMEAPFETRDLERVLGGVPNTMRKVDTLRRMVDKFG